MNIIGNRTMSKAEEFIREHTRNCSNLAHFEDLNGNVWEENTPWLTPDDARRAVEIAREETLQEVKEKLLMMLNTSIDNEHFFEQLDDYIDELKTRNKR